MKKKIDLLRVAYQRGDFKESLRIASNFFTGLMKDEKNIFKQAYEVYTGAGERFYLSLGRGIGGIKLKGIKLLEKKYIKSWKTKK